MSLYGSILKIVKIQEDHAGFLGIGFFSLNLSLEEKFSIIKHLYLHG